MLIAVVQTKVFNGSSANKICFLQVLHTIAFTSLTQFCDFPVMNVFKIPLFTIKVWLLKSQVTALSSLAKVEKFINHSNGQLDT